jgi:hypothetical protein
MTAGSVERSIPLIATSGSVRETRRRSTPIAVDQSYGSDCRRLAHETQYVKAVAFIGSPGPRQLDGPFQLATNLV